LKQQRSFNRRSFCLPGLNGIQAGGRIRKVAPFAKIVFVTLERDPDIVDAAWGLGAWGYVLKSDAARDLVAAIQSVVRGEKFLSRSLDGRRFLDGGEQF
jgi:DNA-binding NarL/FixJ family response regulator